MHTPGPWKAYRADYQAGPNEDGPIFVIGPHEFHTVAKVRAGNEDDDLPAQTPSNASLIAAAPRMLAALENLMGRYDNYLATDRNHQYAYYALVKQAYQYWVEARAAIKAARGE